MKLSHFRARHPRTQVSVQQQVCREAYDHICAPEPAEWKHGHTVVVAYCHRYTRQLVSISSRERSVFKGMTRNEDTTQGAETMNGTGIEGSVAALSLVEDANGTKAVDRLIVGVDFGTTYR